MLLEDFKSCVPESLVVHLNKKRISKLSEAAILADEFIPTHRTVFPPVRSVNSLLVKQRASRELQRVNVFKPGSDSKTTSKSGALKRVCFYCLDPGHLITDCKAWQQTQRGGVCSVSYCS